ncbi:MAG: EVE domain-containing protein [Richelia sp. RM2_1_2]|nr:EVE domain-containing protein [Richelia sp. SM2_1_7]NJM20470.1 EVE domain-containing protein [Richelia sp. SM1_7_0]NJN08095.1 EVE domain-containing protein [Richelia sp. RM1_1_1]NJO28823.1 EVE domain-containing protein [Richelia sp. SL_2_1]NJO60833.1 EVE domain-containing protein [Richelia sp. RM2_1_2]
MNWLLKTEPLEYSYTDLSKENVAVWDGVKNALALKNMRTMRTGEKVFIYHTGKERSIVGVAEVLSEAYPDPKLDDVKRLVIDIRAVQKLPQPITLNQIKQDEFFLGFDLLRLPRLSIVPVLPEHWQRLLKLASGLP